MLGVLAVDSGSVIWHVLPYGETDDRQMRWSYSV